MFLDRVDLRKSRSLRGTARKLMSLDRVDLRIDARATAWDKVTVFDRSNPPYASVQTNCNISVGVALDL